MTTTIIFGNTTADTVDISGIEHHSEDKDLHNAMHGSPQVANSQEQKQIGTPLSISKDSFIETNKNLQILPPKRLGWYKKYVANLTTTWKPWQGNSPFEWCVFETEPSPVALLTNTSAVGLLYMKSYKASSSTLEGINIHMAHTVAHRLHAQSQSTISPPKSLPSDHSLPVCVHYNRHEFGDLRHHARRAQLSLLWTMVREPGRRDLSHVYHFEVGRGGRNATDFNVINTIEYKVKGRQTRYLVKTKGKGKGKGKGKLWPKLELQKDPASIVEIIKRQVMQDYSFIGIVERMEESLAVMTLLWNLEPTDVIVLSAKRSGGYDDAGHGGQCVKIPKANRTPTVLRYLENKHIVANADVLLYHAVNASLDRTIEYLGSDNVQQRTNEIRCLQQLANAKCQDEAYFPCAADGTLQMELAEQSCYVQDAGCGHECVDRVLSDADPASCLSQ